MNAAVERDMLIIKSIDPSAHLALSEYTRNWYVAAKVWISDGAIQSGITEHHGDPEQAIVAFMNRVTDLKPDEFLVTEHYGKYRREWRWNGAAFTECTRSEVLERARDQ